jgi:hypothetical protein
MKTFIAVLAVAATVASPAFAKTQKIATDGAVYYGSQKVGQDPDLNIRFDLRREAPFQKGGSD